MVGAANIICNVTATGWMVEPDLCRVERQQYVTLHLWAMATQCFLTLTRMFDEERHLDIWIPSADAVEDRVQISNWLGSYDRSGLWTATPDLSLDHQLVWLSNTKSGARPILMLVEIESGFAERLGVFDFNQFSCFEERAVSVFNDRYVRLR